MADITMCDGIGCPQKDGCYRHNAPKNEFRQAYFTFTPYEEGRGCDMFMRDDTPAIKDNNESK